MFCMPVFLKLGFPAEPPYTVNNFSIQNVSLNLLFTLSVPFGQMTSPLKAPVSLQLLKSDNNVT